MPLYLGGGLKAEIKVRTAEQKEAVAEYGRAGANAFAEVEQALSAGYALEAREPYTRAPRTQPREPRG